MIAQSLLVLLPSIISGGILTHLIWPERELKSILVKLFLGIGIGLGINSLLFFIYLLVFNRSSGFFVLQIFLAILLVALLILTERRFRFRPGTFKLPGRTQTIFLSLAGIAVILAVTVSATVSLRKPQGAWDSWMIYNRTARFFYRGGEHWRDAFSPQLYWFFHADYPPMIALEVASGWSAIGQETVRVPMLVSASFLFGCAGLLFTGLNAHKTISQASLAILVLFGIPGFIEIGSKQVADIPLSFFILGTGVLFVLYTTRTHKGLLVLAGLSAGLAAWTKNEGIVFVLASVIGLGIAYRKDLKRLLPWYALGLALPIAVLIYFKTTLAPSGDIFVDLASQFRQISDVTRHVEILKRFGLDLMTLFNWVLLVVYAFVLGFENMRNTYPPFLAFLIAILLQLAGYYTIFLISPHPLLWHLSALSRLLLPVGPLIVLLYFNMVRPPETFFK